MTCILSYFLFSWVTKEFSQFSFAGKREIWDTYVVNPFVKRLLITFREKKKFNYLTSPLSTFLAAHIYYKFSLVTLKVSVSVNLPTPAFYFSSIYFLNFLFHVHYTINTFSMNCHWLTDHTIICENLWNKYFIIYFEICFISINTIIFKLPGTI